IESEKLREAPDEIQRLDIAQFGACQATYALREGPDRNEAAKLWQKALIGLIEALNGSKEPKASLRLDGSEDTVRGRSLQLRLGYIPLDAPSTYRIMVTSLA